jgi:hypothetical protein
MLHATNKIAAKKLYLINVKIHNFVWPKQRNQCSSVAEANTSK